jgi:hypothetical protein
VITDTYAPKLGRLRFAHRATWASPRAPTGLGHSAGIDYRGSRCDAHLVRHLPPSLDALAACPSLVGIPLLSVRLQGRHR